MKMKRINYICFIAVLASCFACCKTEETEEIINKTDEITFDILVNPTGVESRTEVVNPVYYDDKQHVTYVHLYIFGDNGDCLLSQNINWVYSNEGSQGIDARSQSVPVNLNSIIGNNQKLKVIALGLDAETYSDGNLSGNSADAYWTENMKGKIDFDNFNIRSGVTDKDGVNPIPRSEIFAGKLELTRQDVSVVGKRHEVVAKRRVAGIIGYFKDIPENIKYIAIGTGTGSYSKAVRLIYDSQVGNIYSDGSNYDDFYVGSESEYLVQGYPIIVEVNGGSENSTAPMNGLSGNSDTQLIKTENEGKIQIMGYMPPVMFSPDELKSNTTLMLFMFNGEKQLVRKIKINNDKSTIPNSRSGTGIIGGGDVSTEFDPTLHYPIGANHFYQIGSPQNYISLDGQETVINLKIDPVWDEHYGGVIDGNENNGVNIDAEWGDKPGGSIIE